MTKQKQTQISEQKKQIVKTLENLMNKKTIMIVSIKSLPSPQLQEIRKKLRGKAEIKIAKKSLINHVLENKEQLKLLIPYIQEDCAIIFSDQDAFELSAFLTDNKSPSKAKPGQIALEDIKVEAGPTSLMPGPDISLLSSAGLQVKIEGGKIAIQQQSVLVKKGEKITEQKSSILGKLDISPFKIGVEPIAAFYEQKIYSEIKVNKEENIKNLVNAFAKCIAFGVSLNYVANETLPFVLAKASSHEKALSSLIKEGESSTK
ncbi:MAG: 50S ribosomal protein L10 [Nanoarchaeota archaeon]